MKPFYVIVEDNGRFIPYNTITYLVNEYNDTKEEKKPKTFDEFKKFIEDKSRYMWWARCEYEIILVNWPCQSKSEKWDVHKQVMMNIDIITEILMENVKN